MVRLQVRSFHKWLGVGTGLVLGVWIVSGVVAVLPRPTPDFMTYPDERPDPAAAVLSPADVVALLSQENRQATSVALRNIGGTLHYEVRDAAGGTAVLDAATGAPFRLSEAEARAYLVARLRSDARISSARRIEAHSFVYPYGDLPAYAFGIAGSLGATVYVTETGRLVPLDLAGKVWLGITGLHVLGLLTPVLGNEGRRLFMAGVGTLTGILVLTGFWLSLPARWRKRGGPARPESAGRS
ncbi:MAG: PepSY domain-containing protein [Gemmatimonadota bacterium]|nr:PepSY domain-containing protein [Gemmatimonadota bacterium]MDH5198773.1 PepSY domain-containing protein [Gemmatimonadota bacterium]